MYKPSKITIKATKIEIPNEIMMALFFTSALLFAAIFASSKLYARWSDNDFCICLITSTPFNNASRASVFLLESDVVSTSPPISSKLFKLSKS